MQFVTPQKYVDLGISTNTKDIADPILKWIQTDATRRKTDSDIAVNDEAIATSALSNQIKDYNFGRMKDANSYLDGKAGERGYNNWAALLEDTNFNASQQTMANQQKFYNEVMKYHKLNQEPMQEQTNTNDKSNLEQVTKAMEKGNEPFMDDDVGHSYGIMNDDGTMTIFSGNIAKNDPDLQAHLESKIASGEIKTLPSRYAVRDSKNVYGAKGVYKYGDNSISYLGDSDLAKAERLGNFYNKTIDDSAKLRVSDKMSFDRARLAAQQEDMTSRIHALVFTGIKDEKERQDLIDKINASENMGAKLKLAVLSSTIESPQMINALRQNPVAANKFFSIIFNSSDSYIEDVLSDKRLQGILKDTHLHKSKYIKEAFKKIDENPRINMPLDSNALSIGKTKNNEYEEYLQIPYDRDFMGDFHNYYIKEARAKSTKDTSSKLSRVQDVLRVKKKASQDDIDDINELRWID